MPQDTDVLNVLVIDDDGGIRGLLVDILAKEGHQVVPAASAEEGLGLLPHWTFQVAYLDFNLPGMNGLVLGEYLRRNNPDMHLALVTGENDRKLERRSRDIAMTYIQKPFQVGDILAIVDAYREAACERLERRLNRDAPDFEPPIGRFLADIGATYAIPNVPRRTQERLVETIKRCLNDLRTVGRYTERDRVIALSGLVAAEVLSVQLPRATSGRTLFEEYDALMRTHGRRTEFE